MLQGEQAMPLGTARHAVTDVSPRASVVMEFGPFMLSPERQLLLENGVPVRIGSRALCLLTVLAEHSGRVVSREELVSRVWPRTIVEETSLRVHMSALRRVLGDGHDGVRYITNLPGRGYSFVAPVVSRLEEAPEVIAPTPAVEHPPSHNLPPRLTRSIGRHDVVRMLGGLLDEWRLVTIVGAGGLGKTTVALDLAEIRLGHYEHGVHFVDLSAVSDPARVQAAVGAALGLAVPTENPWPTIEATLKERSALLVLDNCEHVVEAAAWLADALVRTSSGIHVLATSREPLDAERERVHRLPALGLPDSWESMTAAAATRFPAIQLFAERAKATSDSFELVDATVPVVCHLCRHLDGIPLAIELAAARVDSLGVHGLADRLDDVFELLTRGRRTALPRHRTLQAVLDWSHGLLAEAERVVLRRLSIFRGSFTLEDAASVAADELAAPGQVIDAVMSLTAKSLIVLDLSDGDVVRHRMPYTTRTYAGRRLENSGEKHQIARRHAIHWLETLSAVRADEIKMTRYVWTPRQSPFLPDIRAALSWALDEGGDTVIGSALAVAARRPIYESGAIDELRRLMELALDKLSLAEPRQPTLERPLLASLSTMCGITPIRSRSPSSIFAQTLACADEVGTPEDLIEAAFNVAGGCYGHGEYRTGLAAAQRIFPLVTGDLAPLKVALGDRLLALHLHCLGQHAESRERAMRVLEYRPATVSRRFLSEVPFGVSMRILLARMAWLEGRAENARLLVDEAMREAGGAHPFATCQLMTLAAIPILIWCGDHDGAVRLVDDLERLATRNALAYYQGWGRAFRRALRHLDGTDLVHPDDGVPSDHPLVDDMLATLHPGLLTERTLTRALTEDVGWCAPEVMRVAGERSLVGAATASRDVAAEVEAQWQRADALAQRQGALAWQLRVACSLARLRRVQGRAREGHDRVAAVLARFSEGHDTRDLVDARALLDELASGCPVGGKQHG